MIDLDYIKQYQNDDLCQKWSNNIPCDELDTPNLSLATDSQDIECLCEMFPFLPMEDIKGMIYEMGDGDYKEVYVTESSRPYDLRAIYHPLSYYAK